ncbi:uncharacterized protein METZ01_LOCUS297464 [marine metagenome]|uniref:Uncharacterized protein n=1 Tax=marine metagenome TaxID=408172 RepID=A0A382M7G4_9ZZZZ
MPSPETASATTICITESVIGSTDLLYAHVSARSSWDDPDEQSTANKANTSATIGTSKRSRFKSPLNHQTLKSQQSPSTVPN